MRGKVAKKLSRKVFDFMMSHKIDIRMFKNNYRRVKRAYNRGEYAL